MEHCNFEKLRAQELIDYPPKYFNDYGFCTHCGWNPVESHSHVEHDVTCKYMNKYYDISIDEDGELYCKPNKKKKTKDKKDKKSMAEKFK
jgi:hypothetical protein